MEWISIKERLPKKNIWVLVSWKNKYPMIAIYKGKAAWMSVCDGMWTSDHLTHWMPLPESPKQLNNE